MSRGRSLALLLLLLAAVAAAGRWLVTPRLPAEPRFQPVPLGSGYRDRLVVWDYPWPHPHPPGDPGWFDGRAARTYEERLREALGAFRRRYPGVEVAYRLLDFERGPGEVAAAAGAPDGPDVVAVSWQGPQLPLEVLVPVTPYLDARTREAIHPLAWALARRGKEAWVVPRWVAFHPWLLNRPRAPEPPAGWLLGDAVRLLAGPGAGGRAGADPAFVTLGAQPALLAELLAGWEPTSPGDGEATARALAAALQALRAAAGPDPGRTTVAAPVTTLLVGRYAVAGGLGPGLAHRLLAPPWPGAGPAGEPRPVAPPRLSTAQPAGVPVSLGAFAVLRGPGRSRERIQAAMELAFHLAAWEPEAAVARFLAVPAERGARERWARESPLPAGIRRWLLAALEAAAPAPRAYRPPGPLAPADPNHARLREAWQAFWQEGDPTALAAVVAAALRPGP